MPNVFMLGMHFKSPSLNTSYSVYPATISVISLISCHHREHTYTHTHTHTHTNLPTHTHIYVGKIWLKAFLDAYFIRMYAVFYINNTFIVFFYAMNLFFKTSLFNRNKVDLNLRSEGSIKVDKNELENLVK